MDFDLSSEIAVQNVVEPAVYTANAVGHIINLGGEGVAADEIFRSLTYVIYLGTALVGGGFTCLFEEDDVVGFGTKTTVPADQVIGTSPFFIATDTDHVVRVGITGKKQFQRLTLVETGTVTAGIIGALAIMGHPLRVPVAEQASEPV